MDSQSKPSDKDSVTMITVKSRAVMVFIEMESGIKAIDKPHHFEFPADAGTTDSVGGKCLRSWELGFQKSKFAEFNLLLRSHGDAQRALR